MFHELLFVFRVCLRVSVFYMCVLFVMYCVMLYDVVCLFVCVFFFYNKCLCVLFVNSCVLGVFCLCACVCGLLSCLCVCVFCVCFIV